MQGFDYLIPRVNLVCSADMERRIVALSVTESDPFRHRTCISNRRNRLSRILYCRYYGTDICVCRRSSKSGTLYFG